MTEQQWLYLLYSVIILVVAFILSRIVRYFLRRAIYKAEAKDADEFDPTSYKFLINAVSAIIYLIALLAIFQIIPSLRSFGGKLFAGAGVLTIVVGLASQTALSNIVSGIFIVMFKPFRVKDIITVKNETGTVEDITLRHVIIKNFQNRRIIIPNAVISSDTILNHSIRDSRICNHFQVDVSFEADLQKAIEIIQEEAINHPLTIDGRNVEDIEAGVDIVQVRTVAWKETGVTIRANIWSKDVAEGFQLQCDLYKSIKDRFQDEGIEYAYPHRIVKMVENETFTQA